MSDRRDELEELLVPVALGIADPEEIVRLERAAATDPDLATRLEGLRQTTTLLAEDVPQVEPPASLRKAILGEVKREARGTEPSRGRNLFRWLGPAVGGAVVAGAIAAGIIIGTGGSDSPGLREVPVEQVASTSVTGELVVFDDDEPPVLRLRNLPAATQGTGFEVWEFSGGDPVSGGFLEVTDDGVGTITIADASGVETLAVTREPLTNTAAPTTEPLIQVEVPA